MYNFWFFNKMKCFPIFLVSMAASVGFPAEPIRVDVSRDTWVSSYPTEVEGNNGGSSKLKLKGVQELALIDIDTTELKGKRVTKAQLHLHGEGTETLGRVTVSSISDQWIEGDGSGYQKVQGATSFAWSRTDERRWGNHRPDITGVINSNGGSVWGFGDATPRDPNGWQIIPVDPAVVQARIDDRSFGFCLIDDVGSEYTRDGNQFTYRSFPNRYVSSKDDKRSTRPYFLLWVEADTLAPRPVQANAIAVDVKPALLPSNHEATPVQELPVKCLDAFGEALSSLDFYAAKGESIHFIVTGKARIDLPGIASKAFFMPRVEGYEDPLVPEGFQGAPSNESESTCIELNVPKSAPAGRLDGSLNVGSVSIPCSVTVWNFSLPDRLSFVPQMNCYSLPGHDRDYYRLAHEHRTTLNCLPYHWTGKIDAGPVIADDGHWDWSKWDATYAALFDGTAFRDLPRSGVPIESFYLMLNENWPMNHEQHFKGGYWIENAYDEAYWKQFREAASRIAKHIDEKGWSETMFEFYLNNKVSHKGERWDRCTAAWIFDEPSNTQDFWALRRFGMEFWKGADSYPSVRMTYRADISRPQWQRDLLDGITNVEVISGSLRTYSENVVDRANRFGNLVYMYGSSNAIGTSNVSNAAWCVEAWALGADGVVPWQTVGKAGAWKTMDELSLFYPTSNGPVPSLRLKAFRAGQQMVEYLTMFTELSGETRASVAAAVLNEPGLRALTRKKNEADAGKSAFNSETHRSLTQLRWRLGQWLNAKAPPARDRWHDPRPKPHESRFIRTIEPIP